MRLLSVFVLASALVASVTSDDGRIGDWWNRRKGNVRDVASKVEETFDEIVEDVKDLFTSSEEEDNAEAPSVRREPPRPNIGEVRGPIEAEHLRYCGSHS